MRYIKDAFQFALVGLVASRWRAIVTILTIASAFLLYVFLITLRASFISDAINIPGAKGFTTVNAISPARTLPLAYVAKIKALLGVTDVMYGTTFTGYYQQKTDVDYVSIQAASAFEVMPDPKIHIDPSSLESWRSDKMGALVGSYLARKMNWKVGATIPILDSVLKDDGSTTWTFRINGIYSAPDYPYMDSTMFVHFSYLNDGRLLNKDTALWISGVASGPDSASRVADKIDHLFQHAGPPTLTETSVAGTNALHNFGDVGRIAVYICIAAFFGMLLVTVNVSSQTTYERRFDYAMLKTLGFRMPFLVLVVLFESLIVMLTGVVIGLGLGFVLVHVLEPHLIGLLPKFSFSQISASITVIGVVVLWGLAALDPCFQILRVKNINRMPF